MLTTIPVALALLLLAYCLGSFPTGYLAGRALGGFDIRERGSGSTGATNVLRTLGKGPALGVFAIDVVKGIAAVLAVRLLWPLLTQTLASATVGPEPLLTVDLTVDWLAALGAIAALLGHSRPIWLGFRGGKSVATGLGVLLAMQWPVALASLGGFALVLGLSRIVSISSITAAVTMAVTMFLTTTSLPYLLFAIVGAGFIILRHRSNIERLLAGTEPKLGQSALS